ncbi:tail fiber domain-containing protein [uncultured Hymenobacter sp.]|uniref:tail fiber domain-containing protein n=1 Tax=uncultured Hymenobacter sp. TaxID=170016 RepID=UPI0035CC9184
MKPSTIFRVTALLIMLGVAAGSTASAQVLTPGQTIQGTSVNGTPASGATGPLGQIRSGLFGQFALNDNWSALGESPFGVGGVLPYGLRLQKRSQFGLFNQVTNTGTGAEDLIVGWGENVNSVLRMRFISNQFNNTFTDVLKLQGGTAAPAAEITATAVSGGEIPLRIGVADAPGNFLSITNSTNTAGQFAPAIISTRTNDVRQNLFIVGEVAPANDVIDEFGIGRPLVTILGRRTDGSAIVTRPIFSVNNQNNGRLGNAIFEVRANGQVVASGTVTGSGSLISSDERFKSDIKPLKNGLDMIRKINGRTYAFKKKEFAERSFPDGRMDGFIAQELQKVMPEAVVKQADGFFAVNYDAIIPVLVEAVKQLDAKQTEAAQLQQQLTDLKTQVAELRTLVGKSMDSAPTDKAAPASLDMSQVKLEQNAPNPFGQATRIDYSLPVGITGATLVISDMQGRTVKTLSNLAGGQQAVEVQAGSLSAGVYIYTLRVNGKEVVSRRMVLTR